jgi:phage-related protein
MADEIQTFTWAPAPEPQGDTTFNVSKATFGDGFEQSAANGINNQSDSWPLTFTGAYDKIAAIKAFLDDKQGYKAFYWTPPMGAQALFKCEKYSRVAHTGTVFTLTAQFDQKFAP